MRINVRSGLCNRLRAALSHLAYCRMKKEKLYILWMNEPACNGFFNDYFQPMKGLIVEKKKSLNVPYQWNRGGKMMKNVESVHLFKELQPKPHIQARIDEIVAKEAPFIAIHVRRTDHVDLAQRWNKFTTDEQFFQFIDSHPNCKVYLATDNKTTQQQFIAKYPNRIIVNAPIDDTNSKRKTTLGDAVIDIFVCAKAVQFMGSGWSSFSNTINHLRQETNKSTKTPNKLKTYVLKQSKSTVKHTLKNMRKRITIPIIIRLIKR